MTEILNVELTDEQKRHIQRRKQESGDSMNTTVFLQNEYIPQLIEQDMESDDDG
ncbi:hypothetical protein [Haladaptatus caseinilyticus]|uniref:hypothetical protein n=1 Tax=Haladaptatus caseinilyticus TaxID=2993314 RepID=UPI00224B1F3B|nr:hypothetical protein [Haladaptatus caseinilyticus]